MSQRLHLGLLKDIPKVESRKIYTLYYSPSQVTEYLRQTQLRVPQRRTVLVKYELPSSFSWEEKLPPIRDQGAFNSCAAMATTVPNEFLNRVITEEGNTTDLSEAWLYEISNNLCYCSFCGKWYNQDDFLVDGSPKKCEDINCCGKPTERICNCGRYFYMVIKQLAEFGEPTEDCWSYNNICSGEPPETYGGANPDWCSDWEKQSKKQKIEYETPAITIDNLKHTIYIAPICIGMYVYNNFFDCSGSIYNKEEGAYAGGHGISFIGWDDTERYFWLRNSWGIGWGIDGYCKYSYDLIGSLFDAYALKRHTSKRCDSLWVEAEIQNV